MATKKKKKQEEFISLKDLGFLCLYHWYLFALSLGICIGVAVYYLASTPKTYVRKASLMIQEDNMGKTSNLGDEFKGKGLEIKTTNINNEERHVKSLDVVMEVARQLSLNVTYTIKGKFQDLHPYKDQLPFEMDFTPEKETENCGFDLYIEQPGKYVLSNFKKGQEMMGSPNIIAQLDGGAVNTPLGPVEFKKAEKYKPDLHLHQNIHVSHKSILDAAHQIQEKLTTTVPDEKSTIIELKYTDSNIKRAEDVLTTLAEVYAQVDVNNKKQLIRSSSDFINGRLKLIEAELGSIDSKISEFKSANKITDVQAASSMYMSQYSMSDNQILTLNNELSVARYILEILNDKSKSHELLPATSVISNGSILSQIQEYNSQLLSLKGHLRYTSSQNPLIEDMEQQLVALRNGVIQSLKNEIKTISLQLASYEQYGDKATEKIESNPDQVKYLVTIEREQKIKEDLYMYLLQKKEENDLSESYVTSTCHLLDIPNGSYAPIAPISKNVMLSAIAIGLLIPLGFVFAKNAMNGTIRGRRDLEDRVSMPILGTIPLEKKIKKRKSVSLEIKKKHRRHQKRVLAVKKNSTDILNESFRMIRANIEFVTAKHQNNEGTVFLVASYHANSGKTFVSANLAAACAIRQHKVLVIDCDFRHASSSSYVYRPQTGISDYLGGLVFSAQNIIYPTEEYPNLHFMPVGSIPPNPTELLASKQFAELIAEMKKEYEYIFLDCPPASFMADTTIISHLADRTLFVVRVGLFQRALIETLESDYEKNTFNNMALIVNGEVNDFRYGFNYNYKYNYCYGYDSYKS